MLEHEGRDETFPREDAGAASASAIEPKAIAGAVGAGVVGAAVWAGVAIATNFEIGWIAWGIGAAVGAAFFALGGRGAAGPLLCAAIAVASIGAGKYIAFHVGLQNEMDKLFSSDLLRQHYEECKTFGANYAAAESAEDREKMEREWVAEDGQSPYHVTSRQLEEFRKDALPTILAISRGEKSFEEFEAEFRELVTADVGFADALGAFDLLWIALGVMTAWRLAAGGGGGEPPASRRRGRGPATIAPPPAET